MEIWKEIKGFEGLYEVSNLGRVKSLKRKFTSKEKFLKPYVSTGGYLRVTLSKKGKVKNKKIHQLLAVAFLKHKPCGMKLVVDHINNVKTDHRLDNLQIVTHRYNVSKSTPKGSSEYTGVRYIKKNKNWRAQIVINGKFKHLGIFNDELEAAEAYQKALKELT